VGGTKGASIHVRGVAQALQRRGHAVHLLAARIDPQADDFGLPLESIGFDKQLKQIREEIAQRHNDPLLAKETFGLVMNTRLRLALESLDRRWPIEAVYERYSLWSWAGLHFAREKGVPLILEINAPLVVEQKRYRDLDLGPVADAVESVMLRSADAVIVPSAQLRPHVWKAAGRRRRVHVVPNGVDLDLFQSLPSLPPFETFSRLRERFVVAFLGTLKPWHGVRELLRAFRRLQRSVTNAHLLVIGDGPLGRMIAETQRDVGKDHVTWTGAVAHEDVPGWLSLADVGVAPYPVLEDFYFCPLKVIEYLAAGLPVVGSDQGDVSRLVRHEKTGLLVPAGSVAALTRALERLARRPEERRRMGSRARQHAYRCRGWTHAAEKIEAIAETCRERTGRRSDRGVLARTGS
jgi:glycosyltransferase involved in cell wall biosynthesis